MKNIELFDFTKKIFTEYGKNEQVYQKLGMVTTQNQHLTMITQIMHIS